LNIVIDFCLRQDKILPPVETRVIWFSGQKKRKKGDPKNAGISGDVYENKRPEKAARESLAMLMKNKQVTRFPGDLIEKKES